jgi:hypothetical protein
VVELAQLFQIMPHLGFYDDSKSCSGNAAADRRSLFPVVPNLPFKVEGTIVLGTKLFNKLSQYKNQTAAIAAVCAHEFGHLLQFKYVDQELRQIRDNEGSVVRIELFADFICGYHAGIRKLRQDDYPAVIQALNQFRAGDHIYGGEHHGTPEERGRSVQDGYRVGSDGVIPPEKIARIALEYVKGLTLEAVHSDPGCEQNNR